MAEERCCWAARKGLCVLADVVHAALDDRVLDAEELGDAGLEDHGGWTVWRGGNREATRSCGASAGLYLFARMQQIEKFRCD